MGCAFLCPINLTGLCSGKLSKSLVAVVCGRTCCIYSGVLAGKQCIKFINDKGLGYTAAHINNNFLSEVLTLLWIVEDTNNRFSATVSLFVCFPPS